MSAEQGSTAASKAVSVTIPPSATPAHVSRFLQIFQAIFAALQAAEPMILNILPPKVQIGLEVANVAEPIVVSTVQAIQSADSSSQTQ